MAVHDERLDALTPREHEVLDLVRRGLTNEEIAQHLGITLDGAKYHVSQILSKLGVASRDEAAALAEPRGWPWRRLVGVAVVAAALAGIAVLAWSVLANEEDGDGAVDPSELTFQDLYDHLTRSMSTDDRVLHTRVVQANEAGESELFHEYWTDMDAGLMRIEHYLSSGSLAEFLDLPNSIRRIIVGDSIYYESLEEPTAKTSATFVGRCPGSDSPILAVMLQCSDWDFTSPGRNDPFVEASQFEAEPTVAVSFRQICLVCDEDQIAQTNVVSRIHLDRRTLLPIADAPVSGGVTTNYEHEFVARDALPDDFFDPASIGWTGD